jgi:hypothetical protein
MTALMLSDRFLTFLGASTFPDSKAPFSVSACKGNFCWRPLYVCSCEDPTDMPPKGDMGGFEFADSGEDDGEGSVISGESKVELVVVGDDSEEAVVMDVTLPR